MKNTNKSILVFTLLLFNFYSFSQSNIKYEYVVRTVKFEVANVQIKKSISNVEDNLFALFIDSSNASNESKVLEQTIQTALEIAGKEGLELISINPIIVSMGNRYGVGSVTKAVYKIVMTFKKTIMQQSSTNIQNMYNVSLGGLMLLESYKNVISGFGIKVCNQTLKIPSVSSVMPVIYYGNSNTPGLISFTSFKEDHTKFRTIWADTQNGFTYYGVCTPSPIIWPIGHNNTSNAKFEGGLIEVESYHSSLIPSSQRNYDNMKSLCIDLTKVETILSVDFESSIEPNGINQNEPDLYKNINS